MTSTDEWMARYVKDKLNKSKIENVLDHFLINLPQRSYEKTDIDHRIRLCFKSFHFLQDGLTFTTSILKNPFFARIIKKVHKNVSSLKS